MHHARCHPSCKLIYAAYLGAKVRQMQYPNEKLIITLGYMNNQSIILPEFVEKTLLTEELYTKTSWTKHINWVDQLCALVNLCPVAGGAIAAEIQTIVNSTNSYKAAEFLRKFTAFIYALDGLSDEDRIKFIRELEEKAEDGSGNVILNIVDSLDNINKQKILANLVKAKGTQQISISDFFRLHSALVRIPYVDLGQLPMYEEPYYDNEGDTELLFSTGVLRPAAFSANEGDSYVLSPLGVKLVKYGMLLEVGIPLIKGASTGIEWEEIGEEDIDEMFENVPKKHEQSTTNHGKRDNDALQEQETIA